MEKQKEFDEQKARFAKMEQELDGDSVTALMDVLIDAIEMRYGPLVTLLVLSGGGIWLGITRALPPTGVLWVIRQYLAFLMWLSLRN